MGRTDDELRDISRDLQGSIALRLGEIRMKRTCPFCGAMPGDVANAHVVNVRGRVLLCIYQDVDGTFCYQGEGSSGGGFSPDFIDKRVAEEKLNSPSARRV
jgi:hypothetical protein